MTKINKCWHLLVGTLTNNFCHNSVFPAPVPPLPNCSRTETIRTTLVSSPVAVMTSSSCCCSALCLYWQCSVFHWCLSLVYCRTTGHTPASLGQSLHSRFLSLSLCLIYLCWSISPLLSPIVFYFISLSPSNFFLSRCLSLPSSPRT